MPLFGLFVTSFAVGLSGALMPVPGPLLVATVKGTCLYSYSMAHSPDRSSPSPRTWAHRADLVAVLALVTGLGRFASSNPVMPLWAWHDGHGRIGPGLPPFSSGMVRKAKAWMRFKPKTASIRVRKRTNGSPDPHQASIHSRIRALERI